MANTAHKSNIDEMNIFEQDERRSKGTGDQGGCDSDEMTESYN